MQATFEHSAIQPVRLDLVPRKECKRSSRITAYIYCKPLADSPSAVGNAGWRSGINHGNFDRRRSKTAQAERGKTNAMMSEGPVSIISVASACRLSALAESTQRFRSASSFSL
jgi:hypothetical protein